MPKLLNEKPLTRICLRVYTEDWEELKRLASSDVKRNELARRIIHSYVTQAKDHIRRAVDEAEAQAQAQAPTT